LRACWTGGACGACWSDITLRAGGAGGTGWSCRADVTLRPGGSSRPGGSDLTLRSCGTRWTSRSRRSGGPFRSFGTFGSRRSGGEIHGVDDGVPGGADRCGGLGGVTPDDLNNALADERIGLQGDSKADAVAGLIRLDQPAVFHDDLIAAQIRLHREIHGPQRGGIDVDGGLHVDQLPAAGVEREGEGVAGLERGVTRVVAVGQAQECVGRAVHRNERGRNAEIGDGSDERRTDSRRRAPADSGQHDQQCEQDPSA